MGGTYRGINLYEYSFDDPVNYYDLTGRAARLIISDPTVGTRWALALLTYLDYDTRSAANQQKGKGWIDFDKWSHCAANCDLTLRGLGGEAAGVGYVKEYFLDGFIGGLVKCNDAATPYGKNIKQLDDLRGQFEWEDLEANSVGRQSASERGDCSMCDERWPGP